MRVRVCLPLLLFVLVHAPAWASLIDATSYGSLIRSSTESAAPIAGGFINSDVGSEACTPAMRECPRVIPIGSLGLTRGEHRVTLADRAHPATGYERTGGSIVLLGRPAFKPDRVGLPLELRAIMDKQDSLNSLIDGGYSESAPSTAMIPGPSSLIVAVAGAIAGLALRVRKRATTPRP